MNEVVGISRGVTKKNQTPYTILHMLGEFESYQKPNAVGRTATNIYVPKDLNVNIGDTIEIVYGVGFDNKAVIKDILVLDKHSK